MTRLQLVSNEPGEGPFSPDPARRRLPPGRHGIPADQVVAHQRQRLIAAMAEAAAEHGYGAVTTTHVSEVASVSTTTFYKHFGNLWDCLLAAYVASADRLCERIEVACAARDPRSAPLEVGIGAALEFLSSEPAQAQLLCAQAPFEASAVGAARRLLISRLAAMLRRDRGRTSGASPQPQGLDERLIDASLTFICARICAGEVRSLVGLGPELVTILDRPRRAA